MKFIMFTCVTLSAFGLSFYSAKADDPMASVPVLERAFKEFTPKGFKLGLYDVQPTFSTEIEHTSNVYKSSSNAQSDKISNSNAGLTISRELSDATIVLKGNAEYIKYQKTEDFDQINFEGFAGLSYRFAPTLTGDFQAYAKRDHETRYDAATLTSAFDPIEVNQYGFLTQLAYRPGRIGWDFNFGMVDKSYDDTETVTTGAPAIQSDRDRVTYAGGIDMRFEEYSKGRAFTPFLGLSFARSDYDNRQYDTATSNFSGADQSNTTYDATVGFDMIVGSKLRGSARVGYGIYDPDSNALESDDAGIVKIDLTYLYSPLTNLMFNVARFFSDDTDVGSGVVQTQLDAQIVHELTRRWILNAGLGYTDRSFGNQFEDQTWNGTVGFTHRINENLSLGGDVKYISRESNQQNGDYDETKAMIRLNSKF